MFFLGSLNFQELKDQMVRATAESVCGMIDGCLSRDMSTLYLPILDRSHRRLVSHIHKIIEQAFLERELNIAILSKTYYCCGFFFIIY